MRVIITAQALTDIETIYNFYLPYSEKTAIRICKTIFEYTTILGSFPQIGVVEPLLTEKPGNYR